MKFSLLTYNIWSGKHWKEVIDFLKTTDADVFCLQEVGVYNSYHKESRDIDMRVELQVALSDYNVLYAPISKRVLNNREESFGNAIVTRLPISDSEIHYLLHPLQWTEKHEEQSRNILEATLLVGDKAVTIVTGHLTYAPGFNDTETQIKEVESILTIINGKHPLIFAGDYNSHTDTDVYRRLQAKLPVSDGVRDPTFAKHPFSYEGFSVDHLEYKIDHILATEDIHIEHAKVFDVPYSDHLPILANIEID